MAARGAELPTMRRTPEGRSCEGFRMPTRRGLSTGAEGRRPKACREGTRVGGAGGGRLWRFDGGAARASDALGEGVGGGSTIAAGRAFPLLFSIGRFRRDGRHSTGIQRPWRNGAAAPEASSGG